MRTLYDQINGLFKFAESPVKRVGTGLKPIDDLIGGPAPGEVCMIMARSYAGKSIVGQNIIYNNRNLPSIFFSMEMPYMQAIMRLYSIWSGTRVVDNQHMLEAGEVNPIMWEMITDFPQHLIDDRSALGLDEMSRTLADFDIHFQTRPAFVVVDYLELLGGAKASAEGFVAVESQATMLKDWAKTEEMRVFVLHQTNRSEKKWRPPTEDSARFGGYTEADFVVGMWRPHTDPELDFWEAINLKHKVRFNVIKNRAFFQEKELIEMNFQPNLRIV